MSEEIKNSLETLVETQEELIVYKALYGEGEIWARPKEMFLETVTREGKTFPRFEYIGE